MHKGIILLVKCRDKESAFHKVELFMPRYGNGKVWDWWRIGGRWSGTLNKYNNEFLKVMDGLSSIVLRSVYR